MEKWNNVRRCKLLPTCLWKKALWSDYTKHTFWPTCKKMIFHITPFQLWDMAVAATCCGVVSLQLRGDEKTAEAKDRFTKTSTANVSELDTFSSAHLMISRFGWVHWKIAISLSLQLGFRLTKEIHMEIWRSVLRKSAFLFSFSHSRSPVLPHLPSSCANWRQTHPGTLHLWAFAREPSSYVSLSNRSHTQTQTLKYRWLQPIQIKPRKLPSASGRGASSPPLRIKGHGPRACATWSACQRRKWTCVRDMKMRAGPRGAWERARFSWSSPVRRSGEWWLCQHQPVFDRHRWALDCSVYQMYRVR